MVLLIQFILSLKKAEDHNIFYLELREIFLRLYHSRMCYLHLTNLHNIAKTYVGITYKSSDFVLI